MSDFAFRRFRGIVYRATTYDTPVWVSPNRRPGRWSHPSDRTICQYCSLDPAAAMAEMVRHEDIRTAQDARYLRVKVWELRIDEGAIVDYSSGELVAGQGFEWSALTDDDLRLCQSEGLRIQDSSGRGVVSPSAALPGSLSLTLNGPRTAIAWGAEPRLSIQVPARFILSSSPGSDLVRDVRFFGEPFPDEVEIPAARQLLSTQVF